MWCFTSPVKESIRAQWRAHLPTRRTAAGAETDAVDERLPMPHHAHCVAQLPRGKICERFRRHRCG